MKFTLLVISLKALMSSPSDSIPSSHVFSRSLGEKKTNNAPVPLSTDIQVAYFSAFENNSVRVVFDDVRQTFYANTFGGDIYRIRLVNGVPQYRELLVPTSSHLINRMQGLLYFDSAIYMVGNEADDVNKRGRGRVIKIAINPDGSTGAHTYLMGTEYYASSTTLFDHAFSAICLNKTEDSLFIASGSRTDHGEIKDVGGLYPGLREEPLTTKIFRIPINASGLYFQNNETWLQNSGYVFCEGVRNEFDLALNSKGELFGVENMGDRDDPEELNLLKEGSHYGFPWRMGGNNTPQQFVGYDPSQDLLLPDDLAFPGIFHNDPTFPAPPSGVTFVEPIKNIGPHANWVKNATTGVFEQSSTITTFTGHRSPLGFNLDKDSTLAYPYNASGFVLAYSSGGGSLGYLDSVDEGADLCQVKFNTNLSGNYEVSVTRLAAGFDRPTDAVMVGSDMFVIQENGNMYKVTFPALQNPIASFTNSVDDGCKLKVHFTNTSQNGHETILWDFGDGQFSTENNPVHQFNIAGDKTVTLAVTNPKGTDTIHMTVTIPETLSLAGNTITPIVSGVSKIETSQTLSTPAQQSLFAGQSITMESGFEAQSGTVFKSEIAQGCQ
ncbi:PKD domain-containing protein [Jiulongibacter sediminis]|uniref:PKD domain-containing protein n=1 Tax=Jiulongibacter sediminis TaxID=1605367 RepID=UPI0006DC293F|nr:PKD domain-containing protein [Jiulongibacter sediminis]